MKKQLIQKCQITIDLTQTENDGSFLCPTCNAKISPDERNDTIYTIEDIIVEKGKFTLFIECKTCDTTIKFTSAGEAT
jgi:transcription elongation factor Elf1